MKNIGFDTETYLIGPPNNMIPQIVCASFDMAEAGNLDTEFSSVSSTGDGTSLWTNVKGMWEAAFKEQYRIIIHSAQFDVCVCLRYCMDVLNGSRPGNRDEAQELFLLIWDTLDKSMDNEWETIQSDHAVEKPILVSCTIIREKLKNLSAHGGITFAKGRNVQYGLANLAMHYLGIDMFDKKTSIGQDGRIYDHEGRDITGTPQAGAAWRLRYKELDHIPTKQWPREAYDYALSDSTYARMIWECQERKRSDYRHYSMNSESLQVYSDVCLNLMTAQGFRVDAEQRDKIKESVGKRLETLEHSLKAHGIIRQNGTCNKSVVKDRVAAIHDGWLEGEPLMTPHGDIATGKEVMELVAPYDPVLEVYAERQKLSKIWTSFLPNLIEDRVYTGFDPLKETGRTSSRGSRRKKNQAPLFYAVNSQQIPREPGIREIFLSEPGYLINSSDYSTIELCSVAQVTYDLFRFSIHRDMIRKGYDLHSFMAASVAMKKAPWLVDEYLTDREEAYHAFLAHRKDKIPDEDDSPEADKRRELRDGANKYRQMAKPIDLGYPGGLGPRTMCVFAKSVYHVDISEQESRELRELWLETFPEMKEFFAYVRDRAQDTEHSTRNKVRYCYETRGFRRFRSGAPYCATSNGLAMQSLAADGGKRGLCWIGRAACGGLRGPNPYQILDACIPHTFIHDENLVGIPDDVLATERAVALEQLMVDAMAPHMPDVPIKAEPALSRRWTKLADPEWHDAPEERQQALELCAQVYGDEVAAMVQDRFNPPAGKRLRAWDDHHAIPDMIFGGKE